MQPLFFRPIVKQIVWGGRRLGHLLGKPIGDGSNYAESWEIVDHRSDQSVVESGPWAGKTLRQLIRDHNVELFGRHAGLDAFPLLLKYLDCNRVLSVQVHPDDAYAQRMPQPDLGKTEAWFIVDAQPGSRIYAGLKAGVDHQALQEAIRDGRTEEVLSVVEAQAGQCLFIPAGTIHALGDGLVVAEIQQSSDTTFRLFDWGRVGDDGQPRQLHIEEALQVTDFARGPVTVQQPDCTGDGFETLVQCDKFVLRQICFDGAYWQRASGAKITVGGDHRMHLLTTVRGHAELVTADEPPAALPLGRSVLIPAAAAAVTLRPSSAATTILLAHLP
jgi:mannose-6-phosphate isomerase